MQPEPKQEKKEEKKEEVDLITNSAGNGWEEPVQAFIAG